MTSKEQFVAQWVDEMVGLLLTAYRDNECNPTDMAMKGRYMLQQMRRAKDLLGRLYDDVTKERQ